MGEVVPAIIGEVVVLLLAVAVVWVALRDFVRAALRAAAVIGVLVALAIWLGLLDRTFVLDGLVAVGEWVLALFHPLLNWFRTAVAAL